MEIYFAHPTSTYNTPLEEKLMQVLQGVFPEDDIINPALYQEECQKYVNGPMQYFLEQLIPNCLFGVGLPFADGKFGAGIVKEYYKLKELEKEFCEITQNGLLIPMLTMPKDRMLSREETRAYLKNPEMSYGYSRA